MKEDQIIIIGGGLLGLATANALLDRGEKVLVLERSEETALETSFANAGMLTPSQSAPWNSPPDIARILSGIGRKDSPMTLSVKQIPSLFFWGIKFMFYSRPQSFERISREIFSLANYSKLLTKNIRDSENIRYDESTKGTMKIFRDSERLQQSFDFSKRIYGDSTTKLLNREEVIDLEPQLKEIKDLEGGLHYQSDETGDAYKFCKALEDIVRRKGGRILVKTNIKKIHVNKGKVNSIVTERAVLRARRVIVCAGSWSKDLLKDSGIRIPIRPVKGYSLTYDTSGINDKPKISIIDEGVHIAITPFDNRIRVAGTAEFVGFNEEIHPKRIRYLNAMLKLIYPDLYSKIDLDEGEVWQGFRPMSADGLPFIGETRVKGLFVNTGHGQLGWTLAMGSADLIADHVIGVETQIDSKPYLMNR